MKFFREVKMGTVRIACALALLGTGQALAQNNLVGFELGLGGDNHAADVQAGVWAYFSAGETSDGLTFPANSVITWDARLSATGMHEEVCNPAAGAGDPDACVDPGNPGMFPISGVANFVFDLALHQDTPDGPIAAADFVSSIHGGVDEACSDFAGVEGGDFSPLIGHCGRDATGQADSDEAACDPCYAAAAFAFAYSVSGRGPARAIDQRTGNVCGGTRNPHGGPNLGVFLYPTCEPGKLFGMGAGYAQWMFSSSALQVRPGIGIAAPDPTWTMPADNPPIVEGQIDMTGLPEGTYVLELIPGQGINVVRSDIVVMGEDQPAFAVGADATAGDTITFIIGPSDPPILASAVSRHTHGAAGDFDLELDLAAGDADATIEPRTAGPAQIIMTFEGGDGVAAGDGSLDVSTAPDTSGDIVISEGAGTAQVIGDGNNQIELNLTGVSNLSCLTVALANIVGVSGMALAGDDAFSIRVLAADVSGDNIVDVSDMSRVKGGLFTLVDEANFLTDVTLDGEIDVSDMSAVKGKLFTSVICP